MYSFENCILTSVQLPTTLKRIGERAFCGNSLTDIVIPSSVVFIGGGAFTGNRLSEEKAFIYGRNNDGSEDKTILVSYGSNESHVVVPSGVKTVDNYCFYTNYTVTSLEFSEGLETIKYNALTPTFIKELTIPSTVTTIERGALIKNLSWNIYLTKIINKTGKVFDWGNIINNSSGYQFISGIVHNNGGDVEVTD